MHYPERDGICPLSLVEGHGCLAVIRQDRVVDAYVWAQTLDAHELPELQSRAPHLSQFRDKAFDVAFRQHQGLRRVVVRA